MEPESIEKSSEQPKEKNVGNSFFRQIILALVDKLAIAAILAVIGFYVEKTLREIDDNNNIKLEKLKNEFVRENIKKEQAYLISQDSLGKVYETKGKENDRDYLEKKAMLDREYSERRDDFIRLEDQKNRERKDDIESQRQIFIENLKLQNSMNIGLIRTSLEKSALIWDKVNVVNALSIEFKIKFEKISDLHRFYQDVVENVNRKIDIKVDSMWNDNLSKSPRIPPPQRRRGVPNISYPKMINDLKTEYKNDVLSLYFPKETVTEMIKIEYYKHFGINYLDQKSKIKEAKETIKANSYSIGSVQSKYVTDYLYSYEDAFESLPYEKDLVRVKEILKNLDESQLDIYKMRDSLFKQ